MIRNCLEITRFWRKSWGTCENLWSKSLHSLARISWGNTLSEQSHGVVSKNFTRPWARTLLVLRQELHEVCKFWNNLMVWSCWERSSSDFEPEPHKSLNMKLVRFAIFGTTSWRLLGKNFTRSWARTSQVLEQEPCDYLQSFGKAWPSWDGVVEQDLHEPLSQNLVSPWAKTSRDLEQEPRSRYLMQEPREICAIYWSWGFVLQWNNLYLLARTSWGLLFWTTLHLNLQSGF